MLFHPADIQAAEREDRFAREGFCKAHRRRRVGTQDSPSVPGGRGACRAANPHVACSPEGPDDFGVADSL
jgi:hypothetical protein